MIELIIVAVILILIMLVFVFVLFKNILEKMEENAKKYFVNKMQAYDYILEENREELRKIKSEMAYAKEQNSNIVKTEDDIEEKKQKKNLFESETVKYNLDVPEYRETQFFNNYKEVKKVFAVNNEKIIKDFIAEHKNPKEEKEYKALKKVRDKFSNQTIYEFLTLSNEEQIKILDEGLTDTEKKLVNLNKYTKNKSFNIRKFIKSIDNRMEQIEPTIYVYSSNTNDHFEEIDKNIVSKKYNNMSEGIIIKYRNRIYDYSI
jgi:competence protein ComGC